MEIDTESNGAGTGQEAAVLRDAMVDQIMAGQEQLGVTVTPAVEAALRKVPRHLFTPGVPLETAYGSGSVVAKRDADRGIMLSTVSAPPTIAMMLSQAGDLTGKRVLEIGSGGYQASLLRELVGPGGTVTTLDIDPDVVHRAKACLAAAGYDDVRVLLGDGEHGTADTVFDVIIVTAGAWDIAPAWTSQLAEGGRLVLPLRTIGMTRSWALDCTGDRLESHGNPLMCGFVPMQGSGEHQGRGVPLHDQVGLWLDEDQTIDAAALEGVLSMPRDEAWSRVCIGKRQAFHDQDLWLATHVDGFAVLTAEQEAVDADVVSPSWRLGTPAAVYGPTLTYRAKLRPLDPEQTTFEFGAYAHGPAAAEAADRFAEQIRAWDQHGRPAPRMTVFPAGTPGAELPAGFVLHKRHTTIVLTWPHHAA
ncbi:methyltransferase, FxLD system [Nonomuraea sp. 3N208]|uniref:methyltransferase, FxLD system n=1 Tax=Nonomuraea sp. 3N208 TaxID=3457421 RepID=UPI003FD56F20